MLDQIYYKTLYALDPSGDGYTAGLGERERKTRAQTEALLHTTLNQLHQHERAYKAKFCPDPTREQPLAPKEHRDALRRLSNLSGMIQQLAGHIQAAPMPDEYLLKKQRKRGGPGSQAFCQAQAKAIAACYHIASLIAQSSMDTLAAEEAPVGALISAARQDWGLRNQAAAELVRLP